MDLLIWSLPILSGLADAVSRGVIKLTNVHRFVLIGFGFLFAAPFYLLWLLFEGVPNVQPMFWLIVFVHVPLLVFATILTVEAHRSSAFLLTAPYLALTPAFLLVTSPLMESGNPTYLGALGVLILTVGLYVLNTKESDKDLLTPFRNLWSERGSRLMFFVSIIYSLTANLDYLALVNSSSPFYLMVDHTMVGVISLFIAVVYWKQGRLEKKEISLKGSIMPLFLFGLVTAASVIPQMISLQLIPIVPYVIAGKRTGVILFTVGIGLTLGLTKRFKNRYSAESENLMFRIPGTLLMVFGMIVIIFWGKGS